MRIITITEFRKHYGYYLDLVNSEKIFITKYGKTIAVLHCPNRVGVIEESDCSYKIQ